MLNVNIFCQKVAATSNFFFLDANIIDHYYYLNKILKWIWDDTLMKIKANNILFLKSYKSHNKQNATNFIFSPVPVWIWSFYWNNIQIFVSLPFKWVLYFYNHKILSIHLL